MKSDELSNPVIPSSGSIVIHSTLNDYSLSLSTSELQSIGCKNCIFRLNGNCFHNLSSTSPVTDYPSPGFCPELCTWLLDLAGPDSTPSILWERYHIFVNQLQSSEDYADFKNLDNEIKQLESDSCTDFKKLEKLEMKRTAAKIWWSRLSDSAVKSLSKINDRASRSDNVDKMTNVISLSQIHKLAYDARKEIEDGDTE